MLKLLVLICCLTVFGKSDLNFSYKSSKDMYSFSNGNYYLDCENGNDAGDCRNESYPCLSINYVLDIAGENTSETAYSLFNF
jgi:hypothetical protein